MEVSGIEEAVTVTAASPTMSRPAPPAEPTPPSQNVVNLQGGYQKWIQSGFPVVRDVAMSPDQI